MLGRAIAIAGQAFQNKQDKGGKPYILHCLWVMNKVRHLGEKYMIVGVLHDLVEDTDWTIERLRAEGFSKEVLMAIDIMTHDKEGVSYEVYTSVIYLNDIAREVKLRDLEHNSKITRLKGVTSKDVTRAKKYHTAYIYLKG